MTSLLFIVADSQSRLPANEVKGPLAGFFADALKPQHPEALVLCPENVPLDLPPNVRVVRYRGVLGLEANQPLWETLRQTVLEQIVVVGLLPAIDHEEIVLASHLKAANKLYLGGGDGAVHDISQWEAQLWPDLAPREVRARLLPSADSHAYFRRVHQWLSEQLAKADFQRPVSQARRDPRQSHYTTPRLAVDLAQQTFELQREAHSASFSTVVLPDGRLVHTNDYYRAIANFVMAVPGIETVLDVGCGSGFAACYLAASGRYRQVTGVDSSPTRVASATLHARLVGAKAEFRQSGMSELALPDKSVDLAMTSFALEQTGEFLGEAVKELRRVARKAIVLFEPSSQFFQTLAGLWHLPSAGWASDYYGVLSAAGVPFAVRPNLFNQYFNPGTVFVIDLETDQHPVKRFPQLFAPGIGNWPGGVRIEPA